ncbi:ATP-binding protein [Jiella mangrovi]|uniref:histidine kinase n=1 Tax=Jiella mangrovi TaxID=2821407 RepID=A0ABS4BM86_9HYPH|nr:ATP-binding protein [Jiella mangrovi]MBP0617632.1 two-component sensor histidine kinase [Jiella mangrovi]
MKSLRFRLALLLLVSVLGVVALAALVSLTMLDRPDRDSFRSTFAEEVRIVTTVLREDPTAADRLGITIGPEPTREPDDFVRDRRGIVEGLSAQGLQTDVRIIGDPASRTRQIAFEITPGRWAYLPYPGFPPRNLYGFITYLAVLAAGVAAVSIFAATKMTRPLVILDEAVLTVGPDGLPAHVPEDGPAEVRATASALNRLTARVRTAVESRMRLVAAAGHDLRTPMTRMRLRAEFLPDEERETWLKDLEELDRIADSAIRLVREEVEPQAAEPVRLKPLLAEIVGELGEIGRCVAPPAQAVPDLAVLGRPLALKRALRNLMENAAVHGGNARLALGREGGFAEIVIEDDGPGIPEDMLERAFEPFFRVDPGRRKLKPGAGLGMAIAKEIVDQAGGTIAIANRPEGGLRQRVRLPLAVTA